MAQIQWITFAELGLAPLVFLVGLLQVRLARSAVGDLLVELRAIRRRPISVTRSHAPFAIHR